MPPKRTHTARGKSPKSVITVGAAAATTTTTTTTTTITTTSTPDSILGSGSGSAATVSQKGSDNDGDEECSARQQEFLLRAFTNDRVRLYILAGCNYSVMLKIRQLSRKTCNMVVSQHAYWTEKIHRCRHEVGDLDVNKFAEMTAAYTASDGPKDGQTSADDGLARRTADDIRQELVADDPMLTRKTRFITFTMIEQCFRNAGVIDPATCSPFDWFVAMLVAYRLYTDTAGNERKTFTRSKELTIVDLDAIAFYTVHQRSQRLDMNEGYGQEKGEDNNGDGNKDHDDNDDDDDSNGRGYTHKIVLRVVKKTMACVVVLPLYGYTDPVSYQLSKRPRKCLYAQNSDMIASFEFIADGHVHADVIMSGGSEDAFRSSLGYFVRLAGKNTVTTQQLLEFPYNIIKCHGVSLGFDTVVKAPEDGAIQAQKHATERDYYGRQPMATGTTEIQEDCSGSSSSAGGSGGNGNARPDYLIVDRNCYANTVRVAEYMPSKAVNVDAFWHAMAMLTYDAELDEKHRMTFPGHENLCILIDRYASPHSKRRKLITSLLGMANTRHLFDVQRDKRVERIGDFSQYQLQVKSIVSTQSPLYRRVNEYHAAKAAASRCLRQAMVNRAHFTDVTAALDEDSSLRKDLQAALSSMDDAFALPYISLLDVYRKHEAAVFSEFFGAVLGESPVASR